MSASVLYMSMSLDGYIAGPNDGPGNPGGDGFMRLHEWRSVHRADVASPLFARSAAGEVYDEIGRRPVRRLVGRLHRGAGRSLQRQSSPAC